MKPNTKKPIEKKKQLDAFEYYYSLGEERNRKQVAKKFGVSKHTITVWISSFGWIERIAKRDQAIAKKVSRKIDSEIVDAKLDYRANIKTQLGHIEAIIQDIIDPVTGKPRLIIYDTMDFSRMTLAYERLVRLDLDILGDAPLQNDSAVFKLVDTLSTIVSAGRVTDTPLRNEDTEKNERTSNDVVKVSRKKHTRRKKK